MPRPRIANPDVKLQLDIIKNGTQKLINNPEEGKKVLKELGIKISKKK